MLAEPAHAIGLERVETGEVGSVRKRKTREALRAGGAPRELCFEREACFRKGHARERAQRRGKPSACLACRAPSRAEELAGRPKPGVPDARAPRARYSDGRAL